MTVYVADAVHTRVSHPESTGVTTHPTPAGALHDLDFWLSPAYTWIINRSTVVLRSWPGTRQQLLADIRARGWDTQPTEGGWFTCRRRMPDKTTRIRHLCVLDWVDPEDPMLGPLKPLGDTWNWEAASTNVAQVLTAWERVMGAPYRHTAGVAAHDSIRAHKRIQQPKWSPYKDRGVLESWTPPDHIRPLMWKDRGFWPTTEAVAKFDQRAAYLAAMLAVTLPAEGLKPTGLEPQGPGYLRVTPNNPDHPLWSLVNRPDRQGCVWLGTQTARLFAETGPDQAGWVLVDSHTARGGRLLRTWAKGLERLPVSIRKAVYTQAVGLFNTRTGAIQRADWYHLVVDQANATILRRVNATHRLLGMWPVTVQVDALEYQLGEDQLGALCESLKVGDAVGMMRWEGWH